MADESDVGAGDEAKNPSKDVTKAAPVLFNSDAEGESGEFERVLTQSVHISEQFSGPFPHPKWLEEYQNIDPSLVPKIFEFAKDEQRHRHQLEIRESSQMDKVIALKSSGQKYAFCLSILAIGGGIGLTAASYETTGLISIVGALVTLTSVFIYGKWADANSEVAASETGNSES